MEVDTSTPLLGGLSPAQFMRRHWQKKPLLVRQAWPGVTPPLARPDLFALASKDDVESRLVVQQHGRWTVKPGPLTRRALPRLSQPNWTLLVQGLDLHAEAAHRMLLRFRFVPDARLDDLMVSYASEGGGVGPHTDAYDVFLLQVQGQRRWRYGPVKTPRWKPDTPLKQLADFSHQHECVLAPGDLLYLPPHWGHDGVAVGGDCMTCSIGFRSPQDEELTRELLLRLADEGSDDDPADERAIAGSKTRPGRHYRDHQQVATATPAALPSGLLEFARQAVTRRLTQPLILERVLGEWATEPKAQVWFETGPATASEEDVWRSGGLRLHARTRMMYDDQQLFINGQAYVTSGRDARLLQQLADQRQLDAKDCARLSRGAAAGLAQWWRAGWVVAL